MTDPNNPALVSGRRCIAAIRSLLGAFPMDRESPTDASDWTDIPMFVAEGDSLAVYQLLAINAALVRWMSAETGAVRLRFSTRLLEATSEA